MWKALVYAMAASEMCLMSRVVYVPRDEEEAAAAALLGDDDGRRFMGDLAGNVQRILL